MLVPVESTSSVNAQSNCGCQTGLGLVHAHHSDAITKPGQPVALRLMEKLADGGNVTLEKIL